MAVRIDDVMFLFWDGSFVDHHLFMSEGRVSHKDEESQSMHHTKTHAINATAHLRNSKINCGGNFWV